MLVKPRINSFLAIGIALTGLSIDAGCAEPSVTATDIHALVRRAHDPRTFTEGLLIRDGVLFESTGRYGDSEVRRTDLASGQVKARHKLADRYFGEGLARIDHRLYQLTWKSGTGFVYDANTLAVLGRFHYAGEGWGLTSRRGRLIMSNGTARLTFLDPKTFDVTRRLRVTDHGRLVTHLNELEAVDGEIWANVWLTDRIVRIDPDTGHVIGALDASALAAAMPQTADVLNGIAYDDATDQLYITGKYWPTLFRIARPAATEGSD